MKTCESCEAKIYGEEVLFKVRGEWFCEDCFLEYVKANYEDQYEDDYYDPMTIADDLGIDYRSAQSIGEDNYWDMVDHKIDDLKEGDLFD